MRNIRIAGYGKYAPENTMEFHGECRYRANGSETQLDMAVKAAKRALVSAKMQIEEMDCIVSASAVMMQPIPCNAALIHEQLAKGSNIPAMDINSTCTSFVTALDTMSYLIDAGRYRNVLIVSSDIASEGLNDKQAESYELFSDGAAAFVISRTENEKQGVADSIIRTYSEGTHSTEIRGGGTLRSAMKYRPEDRADYCFDMKGKSILSLSAKKLPELFREFEAQSGISFAEVDMIVPHQASKALPFIMDRLGIPAEKYVNRVSQYGNMVSASIPYVLCALLEEGRLKEGNRVLLCGTAAGLTCNLLLLQL